mmetsp:Transcript_20786/g.43721  ORF Transcript_20786/g.43721 Transcript_20786/m.43721 type:complete len:154 (+) Transcript_20786:226-687(+)|eukprot:CAMPEP_0171331282 /NCGR_PEP_ID=MMETSP0878-20121228/2585_1 /TAXON_ID=67004 /ORGANISM="Thalassiosira weissflogii, Strain CCMP1336" /LENGTH=153 /DNA_ID=CAMNT_0011831781 /DNA_START=175 /DNA_END=636 /DNA_ORIENTATION=-
MKNFTFAFLAILSTALAAEPQRKRSQPIHFTSQQPQENDRILLTSEEPYDRFLGMDSMSYPDASMSMIETPAPTRSPLAEGETFAPTPEPTRSPLKEGETFSPTLAPTRSPLAEGETRAPTASPTESDVEESGASAKGVAVTVALAAGAFMLV